MKGVDYWANKIFRDSKCSDFCVVCKFKKPLSKGSSLMILQLIEKADEDNLLLHNRDQAFPVFEMD